MKDHRTKKANADSIMKCEIRKRKIEQQKQTHTDFLKCERARSSNQKRKKSERRSPKSKRGFFKMRTSEKLRGGTKSNAKKKEDRTKSKRGGFCKMRTPRSERRSSDDQSNKATTKRGGWKIIGLKKANADSIMKCEIRKRKIEQQKQTHTDSLKCERARRSS